MAWFFSFLLIAHMPGMDKTQPNFCDTCCGSIIYGIRAIKPLGISEKF
jgi:hypothetical protein